MARIKAKVAQKKQRISGKTRRATAGPLSPDLLQRMDAYWRASNYLSVGQIYLFDNPLLTQPLGREHIKPRLLGHWGRHPVSTSSTSISTASSPRTTWT